MIMMLASALLGLVATLWVIRVARVRGPLGQ
jgi:phosphate starvation-inducible membrane PsiE